MRIKCLGFCFCFYKSNVVLQEIKPYETKAIARANFYGRATSNHTSYIRIKTDAVEGGVSLVLPVEVEVSDPSGLFLSRELLDFGILKSGGGCVWDSGSAVQGDCDGEVGLWMDTIDIVVGGIHAVVGGSVQWLGVVCSGWG